MAEIPSQQLPNQPTPLGINWKNILVGAVIGAIVVGIGVFAFYLYQGSTEKNTPTQPTTAKTATPSAKTSTVMVKTDKAVYQEREAIKITVRTNLNKPVFYYNPFWHLKEYESEPDIQIPTEVSTVNGRETCGVILYERWLGELKPGKEINDEWDQWICPLGKGKGPFEAELIENGKYSIGFTYGEETRSDDAFTIKDPKTTYSNIFTIK
jgi:hypothetical protein